MNDVRTAGLKRRPANIHQLGSVNLNKLVPRLTISAKLAIAFVMLAIIPLALVAAIAARNAILQMRAGTETTLEFDLDMVSQRITRSITEVEKHVDFLATTFLDQMLSGSSSVPMDESRRIISEYLRSDSSAILRVKVIDIDGTLRFQTSRVFEDMVPPTQNGEQFYLWTAENAPRGHNAIIPVELRGTRALDSVFAVIPAIAIVRAVEFEGVLAGAVVAEAAANTLFDGLEIASPGFAGVSGLIGPDGLLLYHSEHKRDWASLLADRTRIDVHAELGAAADTVLSGGVGMVQSEGQLVGYRSIVTGPRQPSLTLYRAVGLDAVSGSVRRFLLVTGGIGSALLFVVLGISVLAAQQFTKPIYALQRAARRLAEHGETVSLQIETNDELEDLARDFKSMADVVVAHRRDLETAVASQTRALQMTQAELSEVVTHAADAIIGLDPNGRVRLWNDGATQLFGYRQDEAVGQLIGQLIGPNANEFNREDAFITHTLRATDSVVSLATMRRPKSGPPFAVSLTQTPIIDSHGQFLGSSLIIRDNRLQQKLEDQMRRSERLAAVSIMAAGLAHEINNPLAVLGNRIELMRRDANNYETANTQLNKDLDVLGHHVDRLRSLTSDLLSFAREGSDEMRMLSLHDLLSRIVRLLERTFITKGIDLELTPFDHQTEIYGNSAAIETIFVNLLMNAMQATETGGKVTIAVASTARTDQIMIEVTDTGSGVPADRRDHIFEPFFTTKANSGGTGLGLTVCRTIAERHGGEIQLAKYAGSGSTFVVTLPTKEINRGNA